MTDLDEKVVARFREHGNRLFASLPDWPNSTFVTAPNTSVWGQWIKDADGKISKPKRWHHVFRLCVDEIVTAHTLLGQETLGIGVVTEAQVVADRKADGPVFLIFMIRKWYDQAGYQTTFAMRTHDGHWLINRTSPTWESAIAETRKHRRIYEALVPAGIDWDSDVVARDPAPEDHSLDGALFSHVVRVYPDGLLLAFVREQVEVIRLVKQASDGMWLMATPERMWAWKRQYEDGLRTDEAPVVEADPEAHLLTLF